MIRILFNKMKTVELFTHSEEQMYVHGSKNFYNSMVISEASVLFILFINILWENIFIIIVTLTEIITHNKDKTATGQDR